MSDRIESGHVRDIARELDKVDRCTLNMTATSDELDDLADQMDADEAKLAELERRECLHKTTARELGIKVSSVKARLADKWGGWSPTAENVNSLPFPVRRYVHGLETRCDPAGDVRTLRCAQDNLKALETRLVELQKQVPTDGEVLYMGLARRVIGAVLKYNPPTDDPESLDVELAVHRMAYRAEQAEARLVEVEQRYADCLQCLESTRMQRAEVEQERNQWRMCSKEWVVANSWGGWIDNLRVQVATLSAALEQARTENDLNIKAMLETSAALARAEVPACQHEWIHSMGVWHKTCAKCGGVADDELAAPKAALSGAGDDVTK